MMLVILLGMTALSAVQTLIERLDRGLVLEATHWVGADLAINSTQAIPESWQQQAKSMGLRSTLTAEFPSVVFTDDQLKLAAVKAVGPNYPLKGHVRTSNSALSDKEKWTAHPQGPPKGVAWIEKDILQSLNIDTGGRFSLGALALSAGAIVQYEPDRHTNFYSFSPRVLINWQDLHDAKVIQPGSRVQYRLLVALTEDAMVGSAEGNAVLNDFQTWLRNQMRPGDKIITAADDRPTLSRANDRLKLFLNTSLWLTLAMTLVAIALANQNLSHNIFPTFKTLYFLGLTPKALYVWFGLGILIASALASIAGALLGAAGQILLANTFALRLPDTANTLSTQTYLTWFGYGALLPLCMGLASFHTQLAALLHRRPAEAKGTPHLPGIELLLQLFQNPFICALLAILLLLLHQTLSHWWASALLVLGISSVTALLYILFQATLRMWLKSGRNTHSHLAALNLLRLPQLHFFQMLAFVVTVMSGSLAWSLGQEMLTTWQTDLPPETPNVFVINLLPPDKAAFSEQLNAAGVPAPTFYPVVRGRLTAINDALLQQAATKESDVRNQSEALQRDLNFTFQTVRPARNPLTAGQWWPAEQSAQAPYEVSVESKIAGRLDIQIGDRITVTIGDRSLSANVTSLREVTWESFEPNFYFIFEPRAINDFAHTYMGSFYLEPTQSQVLPALANRFSSVNFFDVKTILEQADKLLRNLGQAIWVFGGLTGFIGLIILLICSLHRQALLTTLGTTLLALGASLNWQKRMLHSEAWMLWTLSVGAGFLIAEGIRFTLALRVFNALWQPAFLPIILVGGTLGLCWWLLTKQQIKTLANSQLSVNLRR
jgi:putative ABC transport system permease protein